MVKLSIKDLEDREDDWLDHEGLDEGDELNAWLEEGIQLYNEFINLDNKNPRYSITLADLYLQFGRDLKIRRGNQHQAYNTLRLASIHTASKPDAFYHLSFIFANEDRRWEAVLFYGKEALERGIGGEKKIKLLCNLALAYRRLGYLQKSFDYLKEAVSLDKEKDFSWFIELYKDKMAVKRSEPILLKEAEGMRRAVSRSDSEKLKEGAMEGTCVVLDLVSDDKHVYGINDSIRMERKEAEILGFLMDHALKPCSKETIVNSVWNDQPVSQSIVKKYITKIRKKLSQAMGREDVRENVLTTFEDGYVWKAELKSYVLR